MTNRFFKGNRPDDRESGFLKFFSLENIKKKIISKFQAVWARLCTLKLGFSKSPSLPISGLKIDISLGNVVQMTRFFYGKYLSV
jgi:hypothetical protein